MPEYVAIDLETTGTDPRADRITEVGLVRFDERGPRERFTSLVNPGRDVPAFIRMLPHPESYRITAEELQAAPGFDAIASRVLAFIGDAPVVAQSVSFDLGFLKAGGVQPVGPPIDTHELAGLVLPGLPTYSLRDLAAHFKLDFPVQHRALADAEAHMRVFLELRRLLREHHPDVVAELARLGIAGHWPLTFVFQEVLEEFGRWEGSPFAEVQLRQPDAGWPELTRLDPALAVEAGEVDAALARAQAVSGGPFAEAEERPEQAVLARAVADALSAGGHLVAEAGTGTGKSIAYLLPAALFALRNGRRVVVSTDTISLQEQLLREEMPKVRALLGAEGEALRAAHLKGRRNYLCLRRWASLRRSPVLTADEARVLARILLWLPKTETGDRAELNLSQEEERAWTRVSAEDENCNAANCPFVRDGSCFLARARRRAESAHVLVVNHALLLSDLATGGRLLPAYDEVVVDEAHNLEDEATSRLGFRAGPDEFSRTLDRVETRTKDGVAGLGPSLRFGARALPETSSVRRQIDPRLSAIEELAPQARVAVAALLEAVAFFLKVQGVSPDRDGRPLITQAVRAQPDWLQVEIAWDHLRETLERLCRELEALGAIEAELEDRGEFPMLADALSEVPAALFAVRALVEGVGRVLNRHDRGTIAWLDAMRGLNQTSFCFAPLQVDAILGPAFFRRKRSVVLTSATLSTQGSCEYVEERLGVEGARELVLGSPFDYRRSTLILAPSDVPEPNQPNYQKTVERAIIDLVTASEGRALVLLTSHSAVKATRGGIKAELEARGILVLGQGIDGSARQLLATLRSTQRAVILGAASFWEGVDVIGEALSLLVMARLPFPVPTDPVYEARAELFDEPFEQFALPQAVLRFKQGFGRLIRRKSDRGVFAILDRRILSRDYGRAFLESLPPCEVVDAPLDALPSRVSSWLSRA